MKAAFPRPHPGTSSPPEAAPESPGCPHAAAQASPGPIPSASTPSRPRWCDGAVALPGRPSPRPGWTSAARLIGRYFAHRWAALWQREVLKPGGAARHGPRGA